MRYYLDLDPSVSFLEIKSGICTVMAAPNLPRASTLALEVSQRYEFPDPAYQIVVAAHARRIFFTHDAKRSTRLQVGIDRGLNLGVSRLCHSHLCSPVRPIRRSGHYSAIRCVNLLSRIRTAKLLKRFTHLHEAAVLLCKNVR
jgi:hypothetical protein